MKTDLVGILIPIVIANLVTGAIFLVGFVQLVRRSIDKDIPAKLSSIDGHIAKLDTNVERVGRELIEMRREVDRHGYRLDNLEKTEERRRTDDPDDTGIRRRRPMK